MADVIEFTPEMRDTCDWELPVPFAAATPPAFPVGALPSWMAEWVTATSTSMQTPPDLAGCIALGVASVALAKKYEVQIKSDWCEPLNLYLAVALPPGDRKSAVFRKATQPIKWFERKEREANADELARQEAVLEALQAEEKMLRGRLGKVKDTDERQVVIESLADCKLRISSRRPPVATRLWVDDTTTEALTKVLIDGRGRAAVMSAEGGIFDLMSGLYSSGRANIDLYLKAYSGDPIRVQRTSRDVQDLDSPALTMVLAVQPQVLRNLDGKAVMKGRGLHGRFFWCLPTSLVGARDVDPPPTPKAITQLYRHRMMALLEAPATASKQGELVAKEVEFEHRAWLRFRDFMKWVEPQLGANGEMFSMAEWGSKLAGGVARLAGVLHLAMTLRADAKPPPVSLEAVNRAIQLGEYFVAHARAAFDEMVTDIGDDDARYLLGRLRKLGKYEIARSALQQACRGRRSLRKAEDLEGPLRLLQGQGYVRLEVKKSGGRGRPSPVVLVNPLWLQGPPNSQNFENILSMPGMAGNVSESKDEPNF